MERPRPDLTPEAVYAEVAHVPGMQIFVNAFKLLVGTNQISITDLANALEDPELGIGAGKFTLAALTQEEATEISLIVDKNGQDRAITLQLPTGYFFMERSWDEDDKAFAEYGPGFHYEDRLSEDALSFQDALNDANLLKRAVEAMIGKSPE